MKTAQGCRVATIAEPLAATTHANVRTIELAPDLNGLPRFRLSPGQSPTIAGPPATLRFAQGQDGLDLSADKEVGTGDSLVKGIVVRLFATALSIKRGGSAPKIVIGGGLITHGAGVNPLELHGAIDSLQITEGFAAAGGGFDNV